MKPPPDAIDPRCLDSIVFSQVLDMVDIGLVILDRGLRVRYWNRWMQQHSGIGPDRILGSSLCDIFPNLNRPRFLSNCQTVFTFGNFCFFSQKLHNYLFPFKPISSFDSDFKHMQQSCTMGPLRNEKGEITDLFISVHDMTESVSFEQKLIALNMIDSLTGVHNRRCFEAHLKEEVERHKRYGHPLSLIMFDIDYFKQVNDTYGHQCGDYILREIAELINNSIRSEDRLARYGGEEFCCILPETTLEAAAILAERLRKKIADHVFEYEQDRVRLTISLGVSAMNLNTTTADALLKNADDGLYSAKNRGRNQIEVTP
ncbi:MAG TPA: sensor domain-containing diguanylate cyclase [Desulfobulbaceae bacterium]|nr:sensor domain-containing diguanylate cyclase [Desulfobulbaceae bacterium]